MSINERLFSLLKEKGLTQKEICDATGISTATFSAWKKRGTEPPANDLYAIAALLNTTVDFLITGTEPNKNNTMLPDECELLANYKKLDNRGKHKLHSLIYDELDRMDAQNNQHVSVSSKENVG